MPTNLNKSEEATREIVDLSRLNIRNDFGSYRSVLISGDLEASCASTHKDIYPFAKPRAIKRRLKISDKSEVLDVGCGLGYTVGALTKLIPQGKVHGIDVSEDTIAYAKRTFPNASFRSIAASPETEDIGQFDYIFCFEFYPFTRTSDYLYQSRFICFLARQLKRNGKIIIYQRCGVGESIVPNIDNISTVCSDLVFKIERMPHPRLPLWLPIPMANICATLVSLCGREGFKRFLVISKVSS